MDYCSVTSHVKHKPPGYQSTKYKSSAIAATAAAPTLPNVCPGVVDHLAKAMKQGKEVYIAYANRDPNENKRGRSNHSSGSAMARLSKHYAS